MKNNIKDLIIYFEKLSGEEAWTYLKANKTEVYELHNTMFIQKVSEYNFFETYFIRKNKFNFEKYLNEIFVKDGVVLFYDGIDSVKFKIASAYNLLILLKSDLKELKLGQCNRFIQRIEKSMTTKINYEIYELWDEIQIFFQDICPAHWYFIRKDICKYEFILYLT